MEESSPKGPGGSAAKPSARSEEARFAEYLVRHYGKPSEEARERFEKRPRLSEAIDLLDLAGSLGKQAAEDSGSESVRLSSVIRAIDHGREDGDAHVDQVWREELGADRYEVRGEIGRGGMGIVLQGWDPRLQRDLAIKLASLKRGSEGSRRLARFLEEAQVTAQLDHPGIVPVYDLGAREDGKVFFTMRLVRGRDLRAILTLSREGREGWSLTRAVGILTRVCEAVAYAHSKGVVHRDLKPANIMVGRFGEAYVMDWGLAKLIERDPQTPHETVAVRRAKPGSGRREDLARLVAEREARERASTDAAAGASEEPREERPADDTTPGEILGTPAYMAPEQARGELDEVGPAADVFALGAILYELLTGHAPLADEHPRARGILAAKVRGERPTPIHSLAPEVPAELAAIAERAMAEGPTERYESLLDMAEDLHAYQEVRVVRAHRTGALIELRKWVARNRSTAIASLCAVVAAILGLGLALFVQNRANAELERINQEREETNSLLAAQNAKEIELNRQLAVRNAEYERRDDALRLQALERRAAALLPPTPDKVPALEAWLAEADELVSHLRQHEASLESIRARALELDADGRPVFADEADRWQEEALARVVSELQSFQRPNELLLAGYDLDRGSEFDAKPKAMPVEGPTPFRGLQAAVANRLALAERLGLASIADHQEAWAEAIASIAAAPVYGGLTLEPQIGLVPLGRNPQSGLWEFAHLPSGELPPMDREGRWVVEEASGLILVLIPPGELTVGREAWPRGLAPDTELALGDLPDWENPNLYQAGAPLPRIPLDAFFLSKYEMTQAQWERIVGRNPSQYFPGSAYEARYLTRVDLRHPVESVSWEDCAAVLAILGLDFPTEAQWEHAARAGNPGLWQTGNDPGDLPWHANLLDRRGIEARLQTAATPLPSSADDGFPVHAPVGRFAPNDFGLHDVHGNVWEWCRDLAGEYWFSPVTAEGDGERRVNEATYRILRGGSFITPAQDARLGARRHEPPGHKIHEAGLRPARALD